MLGLKFLFITVIGVPLVEPRTGKIINFDPPDPNDPLYKVLEKATDINAAHKDGSLVVDHKLAQFTASLEQYCYENNEITQIEFEQTPWCSGGRYQLLRLQYGDRDLDCIRVTTEIKAEALASIKPIVIKRFYLKVFYLMVSGECYVKYFELPVYECLAGRHIKLSAERCQELFPEGFAGVFQMENIGDDSD